jgi:hypothetical protein
VRSVRKAAERIGKHRRSLPWLQAPENDVRAVNTPRRSLGHNGRWRAAKKDGARDAAGGSHLALPPPPGTVDRIGPICAPGFPPPSPLGAAFGRSQFAPGKGKVGKLKRLVCCAHERASVIARLPAADRARIFSANRSMTIVVDGRHWNGVSVLRELRKKVSICKCLHAG